MPAPNFLAELRSSLHQSFSVEDLAIVCADLGLEYAALAGEGKAGKLLSLTEQLRHERRLHELLKYCRDKRPNTHWPNIQDDPIPDAPDSEPPFMGLQYFDVQHASIFFGRERLIGKIIGRLRHNPFLTVVGASGSGKSSLIRAGVIARLLNEQVLPGVTHPLTYIFTPTAHPLKSLSSVLTRDSQSARDALQLMDDMRADTRSLDIHVHRLMSDKRGRVLLVVDQFEELFTACKDVNERQAFVDNLMNTTLHSADDHQENTPLIIFALRADFYAECAAFEKLRLALVSHQEFIGPMDREEVRRAIEAPAELQGWEFEPGLVDTLLRDVGGEPGALPLLSHALLETWKRRSGRVMTLRGYTESGSLRGAIARTADQLYASFSSTEQRLARDIFLHLTELDESAPDTRRRVSFNELFPQAIEEPVTRAVLKKLADARLVTTAQNTAEVAHEALIREWPQLRTWLDENRDRLRLQRRLIEDAQAWDALQRDEGVLYRGVRLAHANVLAESGAWMTTSLERDFLKASNVLLQREDQEREQQRLRELQAAQKVAEEQRRSAETERRRANEQTSSAKRLRAVISGLVVVALLTLAASGLAFVSRNQAVQSASQALAAESTAQAEASEADRARGTAVAAQATTVAERKQSLSRVKTAQAITHRVDLGEHELALLLATASIQEQQTAEAQNAFENAFRRAYFAPRLYAHLQGHTGEIRAVAFSPDSHLLASASLDGTLCFWDVSTGTQRNCLSAEGHGLYSLRFSTDGKRVVAGSDGMAAYLWDVSTGSLVQKLVGRGAKMVDAAFSPDGKQIVTLNVSEVVPTTSEVQLWDADTGQPLQTLLQVETRLTSAQYAPDGKRIAVTGNDALIRLWDIDKTEWEEPLQGNTEAVNALDFSPDSELILSGGEDSVVSAWSISSGVKRIALPKFDNHIVSVRFSADGKRIITGNVDRTVQVWEADVLTGSGRQMMRLGGYPGIMWGVAFSSDGRWIATAGQGSEVQIWFAQTGREQDSFVGHDEGVTSAQFSPDGNYVLTSSEDYTARIWDVKTKQAKTITATVRHASDVIRAAFSPSGDRFVTASRDGTAVVWDANNYSPIYTLSDHAGRVYQANFSPDGKQILTACGDGKVRIWDAVTGVQILAFAVSDPVSDVSGAAFSFSGKRIATGTVNGAVSLWNAETGDELLKLSGHSTVISSIRFSLDDRWVITSSYDRTARIWDSQTGQEIRRLVGHDDLISEAAISPNGQYIATSSWDNTARLWDATTGQELVILIQQDADATGIAFSPDGKTVIVSSNDKLATLVEVNLSDLLVKAQKSLVRELTCPERKKYIDENLDCPSG